MRGWLFGIILAPLIGAWTANADAATLSCAQAAAVAEADMALPPGLLLAIGTVESGRVDASGHRSPWPWTIDAGGTGRFFDTAEDAIRAVGDLRAGGVRSVDIGCFQINLWHHPDAFADLASGFDPLTNAQAAGRFLLSLHAEFADWGAAVAAYHSRADTRGVPYREQVMTAWHGSSPAPREVLVAGVHVWGPAGTLGSDIAPSSQWTRVSMLTAAPRGLPRVMTPAPP